MAQSASRTGAVCGVFGARRLLRHQNMTVSIDATKLIPSLV